MTEEILVCRNNMDKITYTEASKALDGIKSGIKTDIGILQIIPTSRYDEVLYLMDEFNTDAPVNAAFGIHRSPLIDSLYCKLLDSNLSIMMVHKDTNEIMGIRINHVIRRCDVTMLLDGFPDKYQDMIAFSEHVEKNIRLFDILGVDEVLKFAYMAVSRKYRRLSVGSILMQAGVDLARKLGFGAIKAEGESIYSQKIFSKMGFETLLDYPYDSYMYNGEPLGNKTGIHRSKTICVKRL